MMPVNTLWIDQNPDGYGWLIDATPKEDLEFSRRDGVGSLSAASGDASDRMDLLTVLMHEMGHALGLGHDHDSDSLKVGAGLMSETLPPGLRRLIGDSEWLRFILKGSQKLAGGRRQAHHRST